MREFDPLFIGILTLATLQSMFDMLSALYVITGVRTTRSTYDVFVLGSVRPITCFIPLAIGASLLIMVLSDMLILRAWGLVNVVAQSFSALMWTYRDGSMMKVLALDDSKTIDDVLWCSNDKDERQQNIIFYLLIHNREELAMQVQPTDPLRKEKDLSGRRPFFLAAFFGQVGFLAQESDSDLKDEADREGWQVGHYAAAGKQGDVLVHLALRGVCPNPMNSRNRIKASELWPEFDWDSVRTID